MSQTRSKMITGQKLDDGIEDIITRVCTNFTNKLEAKFDRRMDKLDEKLDQKFLALDNTIRTLSNEVTANKKAILALEDDYDVMQQRFKRNSLRLTGFAESSDQDQLSAVIEFINNNLKISCGNGDIDSVVRIGKKEESDKPRTLIVQFVSNNKRMEVFNAKRLLKNTKVAIHEDLTKTRYKLLLAAKEKYGKNHAWSTSGRIYVWCNQSNKKRLIYSENDL